MHIRGGSLQPDIRDLSSCITSCDADNSCLAVDFNFQHNTCWYHGRKTACSNLRRKQSCVHHKLVNCIGWYHISVLEICTSAMNTLRCVLNSLVADDRKGFKKLLLGRGVIKPTLSFLSSQTFIYSQPECAANSISIGP